MRSKNKPAPRVDERRHIERIAAMSCAVCGCDGPSEVHEPEQGLWFVAIPLCAVCHRDNRYGLHGQRLNWKALKVDEWKALNETLRKVLA